MFFFRLSSTQVVKLQNSWSSSCQFLNDKSVPLQSLNHSSLSWHIIPLLILSLYFFYFGLKDPIKVPILRLSIALMKIFHIPHVIFQTTNQFFFEFCFIPSGSWDITPLYFLAKILYILRSLSMLKFGEILCKQSKVWNLSLWWAPFVQIMYSFS